MINFQLIQDTVNRLRSFLSLGIRSSGPTNTTSLIQHNPTSALQCLQKNIIVMLLIMIYAFYSIQFHTSQTYHHSNFIMYNQLEKLEAAKAA